MHHNVIVLHIVVTTAAHALIRPAEARTRIHGADGHAILGIDYLHLDFLGITAPAAFDGDDFRLVTGGSDRAYVAVRALDFERLARRYATAPMKLLVALRAHTHWC